MSWIDHMPIAVFLKWIRGVLSEADGTPSSTRTLMFAFSFFSMWLIWRCFYHVFQLHDPNQVIMWLSNMPLLIASLMGLIALPYGINKGTATFSDIANLVTNARKSLPLSLPLSSLSLPSTPVAVAPTPPAGNTGSPGAKG